MTPGTGRIILTARRREGRGRSSLGFAEDVLRALAWPAILGGNLVAVVAMALYFKPRHPNVRMRP
jgi:hypothetical protein